MRIVEIEKESARSRWVVWIVAGAVVGVGAGVLVSEGLSGRRASARTLWRRVRSLAKVAGAQWVPLLELGLELRERWAERRAEALALADDEGDEWAGEEEAFDAELDEALDDDPDDDSDDDPDDDPDDELDDELDEEADDEDEDKSLEADDAAGGAASDDVIGSRVLEAFLNDPILSERAVEIDADALGGVFLHGRVRTAREVAHAVTLAGGVPGVTAVRQKIRVSDRR